MFITRVTSPASRSLFSPSVPSVPTRARTRVNKACDGMSARGVEPSRLESHGSLWRCQAPRLFAILPSSPAEHSPPFPYPSPASFLLSRSRLHLLRWNRLLPSPRCIFFTAILFLAVLGGGGGGGGARRQMSPTSPPKKWKRNRKRQPLPPSPPPPGDNPRLRQNFN